MKIWEISYMQSGRWATLKAIVAATTSTGAVRKLCKKKHVSYARIKGVQQIDCHVVIVK